jgi:hypothetical protein
VAKFIFSRENVNTTLTAKTFFDGFLLAAVSMFLRNPMGPRVHIYGTVHGVCCCMREEGDQRDRIEGITVL